MENECLSGPFHPLWIRVRLVGALAQFGMLEHPKMRESILVAPRIPNCSRGISEITSVLALLLAVSKDAPCIL